MMDEWEARIGDLELALVRRHDTHDTQLDRIESKLDQLLTQGVKIMATQADEAVELTIEEGLVAKVGTDVLAEITTLEDALKSGQDTQPNIDRLKAIGAALLATDSAALAAGTPASVPASTVTAADDTGTTTDTTQAA